MKWRASDMNPILLIAVPLLAALFAVAFKKIGRVLLGMAAVFNFAAALMITIWYVEPQVIVIGGFRPPFGVSLVLDGYSLTGVLLLNAIFALIMLMSFRHTSKLAAVLSITLAALNGMVLTGDLFNLFVFMEIGAIAAYIITTANRDLRHTFNYLIVGSLGSGLFLFGVILLYTLFGTLNMGDMQSKMAASPAPMQQALILPLVLLFAGLAVETKLIPFGGWVRGVLKDANPLTGSLIVSAYAFAALLVFGRIFGEMFVLSGALLTAFTIVAAATLVLAEASAFSRRTLRETLLYSSIAQSGLVVLLFLNHMALPAVLVLISNVVSKLILFTVSGQLAEACGTDETDRLQGAFFRYPLLGVGFTIAALSLIGIPLFFGFSAKLNALSALFGQGNWILPAVILLMGVVEGVYYIRILSALWHAGQEGETSAKDKLAQFPPVRQAVTGIVGLVIALLIVSAGIVTLSSFGTSGANDFITLIRQSLGGM
ncbi:MAG: NADH-ubiquinone oxidoreductase [Clostridiales bacterium]|nr:NADH-ubiquinone oxidoreductase [Clostridiales bacterium]